MKPTPFRVSGPVSKESTGLNQGLVQVTKELLVAIWSVVQVKFEALYKTNWTLNLWETYKYSNR